MVLLAVVGAVVLALVSWAALREAQRLPRSFPAARRVNAAAPTTDVRAAGDHREPSPAAVNGHASAVNGHAVPVGLRTHVVGDATVAEADTDEALAAAAALWHVLVDEERA